MERFYIFINLWSYEILKSRTQRKRALHGKKEILLLEEVTEVPVLPPSLWNQVTERQDIKVYQQSCSL